MGGISKVSANLGATESTHLDNWVAKNSAQFHAHDADIKAAMEKDPAFAAKMNKLREDRKNESAARTAQATQIVAQHKATTGQNLDVKTVRFNLFMKTVPAHNAEMARVIEDTKKNLEEVREMNAQADAVIKDGAEVVQQYREQTYKLTGIADRFARYFKKKYPNARDYVGENRALQESSIARAPAVQFTDGHSVNWYTRLKSLFAW